MTSLEEYLAQAIDRIHQNALYRCSWQDVLRECEDALAHTDLISRKVKEKIESRS